MFESVSMKIYSARKCIFLKGAIKLAVIRFVSWLKCNKKLEEFFFVGHQILEEDTLILIPYMPW